MNLSLDLSPWLSRSSMEISNEELRALISLLAKAIRRNGVPLFHDLRPDISKNAEMVKEFESWEKKLSDEIAKKYSDATSTAVEFIVRKSIRANCGCKVICAFYNGAGSFDPMAERAFYRKDLAYTILAQAGLLSLYGKNTWLVEAAQEKNGGVNCLYRLARDILATDEQIFLLPFHAVTDKEEFFHGILIALFEKDKTIDEDLKTALGYFVHCLGKTIGSERKYSFPAVNGGYVFQHIEKELFETPFDEPRKIFQVKKPMLPSLDMWCGVDHKKNSNGGFDKMIRDNIEWCQDQLNVKGRHDLIPLISNVLRDIFSAEECFFVRRNKEAEYDVIGKKPETKTEKYENAAALSAMLGLPYQTADDDNVIIAIPHYVCGGKMFIGSSIVCVNRAKPPLIRFAWRQALCFCHHLFNALYSPIGDISSERYLNACPWHTYVDSLDYTIYKDNPIFPPALSRKAEDIARFGKKELEQISEWLSDCQKQRGLPWGTGLTYLKELKFYEEEDAAEELHQTTTTTIMDLCERAAKDDWPKTMKSVFGEIPKFFGSEEIALMWLAVLGKGQHFDIHHSLKGELDEEGTMVCEIIAQVAAQRDAPFFLSSDDPDAYAKLLRSKIGNFSFVVMPIYNEDEVSVRPDGWHKNPGGFIGAFVLAVRPGRPVPSDAEWSRWGMFIPRLCLVMQKAAEAKKFSYCIGMPAQNESAFVQKMRLSCR